MKYEPFEMTEAGAEKGKDKDNEWDKIDFTFFLGLLWELSFVSLKDLKS